MTDGQYGCLVIAITVSICLIVGYLLERRDEKRGK